MHAASNMITGLLEPGVVIGEYQISELIGRGAIAEVYRACQMKLDRDVAIKIVPPHEDWDSEIVDLFEQEAKTIARLNHPNIVQVIDCGRHEKLYYFVMEYVDGTDFSVILKEKLYDLPQRIDVVVQVIKALIYAHNNGIIHRDIKPANLLISSDGHVKVADFGIALKTDNNQIPLSESGKILGTPLYMAPEQLQSSDKIDYRADIYSVGMILYEALTSKRPGSDPPPPSAICSEAPPEFDSIVQKCLTVNPDDRYRSAVELKDELLAAINVAFKRDHHPISDNTSRRASSCLLDKYTHLDTLRESPFGATYLVKNSKNDKLYIIKKLCRDISGIREARILSGLNHPNLIRIFGAGKDAEKGILITEYIQGGSLADRLIKPYPVRQALDIFKQVSNGLSYAHKNGILHGNLRPSNILFDEYNKIKLTDFALPEHYAKRKSNWYGAPERQKSTAFDIYSIGVMLYQLLTTRIPDIRAGGDLAWKSRSHDGRFSLLNIMSQMLERDPKKRPSSFDTILQQIEELGYSSPNTPQGPQIDHTVVARLPHT